VKADGGNICRWSRMTAYATFECDTEDTDFGASAMDLKIKIGDTEVPCASTDTTTCQYTQSMPANGEIATETFPRF
jgi:hypothetical protein